MENQQPLENGGAPAQPAAVLNEQPVIAIQRTTINYAVIALVCFGIGLVIGAIGVERLTANRDEQLIRAAVSQALASSRSETQAMIADALASAGLEAAPDPNRRQVVNSDGPFQGPEDAPVTIVAFEDFRCGFCKRFNDETLNQILENYPTQVRYVHRDFPILGPASDDSAVAAQCAHDQGRFWEFHERFYGDQTRLTEADFTAYAAELEMDVTAFTACYQARTPEAGIDADLAEGQQLGVQGTPTFFVNGRILIGAQPYDVFASYIEAELTAAAEAAASS
ncbi:MAG: thioredoxin domain-containing protein [bacterium]|nr:thioredoxin domain-containing protein [bacterium]